MMPGAPVRRSLRLIEQSHADHTRLLTSRPVGEHGRERFASGHRTTSRCAACVAASWAAAKAAAYPARFSFVLHCSHMNVGWLSGTACTCWHL